MNIQNKTNTYSKNLQESLLQVLRETIVIYKHTGATLTSVTRDYCDL